MKHNSQVVTSPYLLALMWGLWAEKTKQNNSALEMDKKPIAEEISDLIRGTVTRNQ